MFAGLITGNPVIVKPHPGSVYPIAIVIGELQKVLSENGINPCVIQLAADSQTHLITKELAEHGDVALIDYTGGSAFGGYIEGLAGKTTFTEKAGVNSVIIESCNNLDEVISNLSFAVSLYSGQMCTAPQNFFIPKTGIKTNDGVVGFDDFVEKFKNAVSGLATHPKMAAGTFGAIQNPATLERAMAAKNLSKAVLESGQIANEEYPNARTCSPTILELKGDANNVYEQELFGPIVLIIACDSATDAIEKAQHLCKKHGAITCAAYTTDDAVKADIVAAMESVFCPVSFNLTGFIWVNQHAAFSDFHVSGGNPAGNASFTNSEFITKRFVWLGNREVVG
jgi:phenylacetic acid degradation protein paaN